MDESAELQLKPVPDDTSRVDAGRPELESIRTQLRVEQKRFTQVLEFAPDACLLTDDRGLIRQANRAAALLLNLPKNQLIGAPLIHFITPDTRARFPGNLVHAVPDPIVRIYEPHLKPEVGDPFPCSLRVMALASTVPDHPNFLWTLRNTAQRQPADSVGIFNDVQAIHLLDEIASEFGAKPNRRSRLRTVADRIKLLFQARSLAIYLYDVERGELELEIAKGLPTIPGTHVRVGEGIIGMVAQDRQPMLVENYTDWPFLEPQAEDRSISAAIAPMLCFDGLVGVMAIAEAEDAGREYNWEDVRLLSVFASLAAWMVNAANSRDLAKEERARRKHAERDLKAALGKVKSLSAKIEVIREEERKQLARQIHDELGQLLTGFRLDLGWLAKNQQAILEKSQSLLELSDSTIKSVQRISTELRPGVLDELGLVQALEWQAQDFQTRYGIECVTDLRIQEHSLDRNLCTAVFRIFQEALTNVARHAHATRISIELAEEKGYLVLQVEDNGHGIEESQAKSPKSLGLVGMRERAEAFGGKVEVSGSPNLGTTVTARFPLHILTEGTP